MARHPLAGYKILTCLNPPGEDGTFIAVELDGFPEWVVEAVIVNTDAGPGVSAQFIYARQDDGYGRSATVGWKRHNDAIYDALLIEESVRVHYPDVIDPLGSSGLVPQELNRAISHRKLVDLARYVALERADYATDLAATITADEAVSLVARQVGPLWRRSAEHTRSLTRPVKRTGRKGNGIAHYLDWAMQCDELTRAGNKQVRKMLLRDHGGEASAYSREYIRDQLRDARRKKLLSSLGPGNGGGELTDHAIKLLEDIDFSEIKGPEWDDDRLNKFVARRARTLELRVSR